MLLDVAPIICLSFHGTFVRSIWSLQWSCHSNCGLFLLLGFLLVYCLAPMESITSAWTSISSMLSDDFFRFHKVLCHLSEQSALPGIHRRTHHTADHFCSAVIVRVSGHGTKRLPLSIRGGLLSISLGHVSPAVLSAPDFLLLFHLRRNVLLSSSPSVEI